VRKVTICFAVLAGLLLTQGSLRAQGGYSAPVRLVTPIAPRCIDSKTDEVTIDLKRILLQKKSYVFTQDSKAGVAVMASLNASGNSKAAAPSVSTVPIKDEPEGQVSLAIEYPVADQLVLTQDKLVTRNIQLDIFIEKAKENNAFGDVLNLAGQVLQKLPIPDNPYVSMANQFLTFANGAINTEVQNSDNAIQIASISLLFNNTAETNIDNCVAQNYQTTGAIAVLKSDSGADDQKLLPVENLDQSYCFRYLLAPVAELQYVSQPAAGCKALDASATWSEVPNDYLMLIISAAPTAGGALHAEGADSSARPERRHALENSRALCREFGSDPKYCGIR
jgi:hypothetical protein